MKEGEPKEPSSLLMEVNAYLEAKTMLGEEIPTIESIAEGLKIPHQDLNKWVSEDQEFSDGLKRLKTIQDIDLFADDLVGNRADAMLVALLLLV